MSKLMSPQGKRIKIQEILNTRWEYPAQAAKHAKEFRRRRRLRSLKKTDPPLQEGGVAVIL